MPLGRNMVRPPCGSFLSICPVLWSTLRYSHVPVSREYTQPVPHLLLQELRWDD